MPQVPVTLDEIITAVRELTFDRFIIPAFALRAMAGWTISVTPPVGGDLGRLSLDKAVVGEEPEQHKVFEFSEFKTLESLMQELIVQDIIVAYTPYFKGTEPTSSLIKVSNIPLTNNFTAFRRFFFSDAEIEDRIRWYYLRVLELPNIVLDESTIARLVRPSEQHMAIWVAYQLVDKRRLYENAASAIGQSFTDGSDYTGSGTATVPLTTSVQIGSVFSITEDATEGYFQEDFNRIGSDNVWGDRYSFWYRLMLYLRQLLEETFGDYSLRKNTVMSGHIELTRELDFRSYFDSYPFTLSPLSRGILSKTN
jgi:hypothetical protein